jgi:hypothetical protein
MLAKYWQALTCLPAGDAFGMTLFRRKLNRELIDKNVFPM